MAEAGSRSTDAQRLARQAWRQLHVDSRRAARLAERALAVALAARDTPGEGWARLARGFHLLYFARPRDALAELLRAQACFEAAGDRAGIVLAATGRARGLWREGRFDESLALILPLRDEGLAVLQHDQRGVLLNTIAGCYSARNESEQAFAYMYQALRDARPARRRGFDAVIHCNIAHELMQLGDHDEALRHVDAGIEECRGLKNPRLHAVLLINRVICLTELDRADEALPHVHEVCAIPADASGRGTLASHFETLAIAALRAGDVALGRGLVEQALAVEREAIPDEHLELAIATALLAAAEGNPARGVRHLTRVREQASAEGGGLSLRMRAAYWQLLSELHERLGNTGVALKALREWQRTERARAELASRAHYQAAALQTELLMMQRMLERKDAQRRATERARAELQAAHEALSERMAQVQALQARLKQQATRDELTGLFNRRHLNDTLPSMWALAARDEQPLAAAIIDLDHFKAVNDHQGHDAGDRLLAAFGRLLSASLRKSDVACRYGGEEFCVLMPHTDAVAARRKIAALLKRWRSEALLLGARGEAGTSFSAGVSDSRRVRTSPQALLKSADDELLAAKREGRNRVRMAEPAAAAA
jgi:diguanylate cyclase (GGDEF)-like protein